MPGRGPESLHPTEQQKRESRRSQSAFNDYHHSKFDETLRRKKLPDKPQPEPDREPQSSTSSAGQTRQNEI